MSSGFDDTFLLDFYVKAVLTARAYNRVLTLLSWQTKVVLARGALLVNVSFPVPVLAFLQLIEILRNIRNFDEFLIFLLPFVNIF